MIVALLGAECTGKSTLAHALAHHLRAAMERLGRPPHVAVVDEWLRTWCETQGRPPQAHEQAQVAAQQDERIRHAAQHVGPQGWVLADTTSLMTAAYSDHYFGSTPWFDRPPPEAALPMGPHVHLLLGLDLPWQADGPWRDGPTAQAAVDACLRQRLLASGRRHHAVYGQGPARTAAALAALAAETPDAALASAIKTEAITLYPACANAEKSTKNDWMCNACSDPGCERRLFSRLMAARGLGPSSTA